MNFKSLSSFFFQFRIWHLKWGIHTMDHQWSHCERSLGKTPRGLYSLWGVSSLNSCKGPSGLLSRAFYLIDGSKQLKMLIVFSCGCIYTWCNLYATKGSTIPTERRYSHHSIKRTCSIKRPCLKIFKKSLLNVLYDRKIEGLNILSYCLYWTTWSEKLKHLFDTALGW